MSFSETVLLGALAGFTIYLGLPLARMRLLGARARVALAMFAVGVLAFLFVDVMSHGEGILEHAVKGFGLIRPLGDVRPSWRWLGVAGLIGGGPVFLGSMLGYNVTSEPLELGFYALAGGAILYVIGEIWQGMRRHGHRELGLALLTA